MGGGAPVQGGAWDRPHTSEQSDQERCTGEAGRPGAEHGRIYEEDHWRAGGRAATTKEQRWCDQEGRGAMSQKLEPGTRRGGANRSRGGRRRSPKEKEECRRKTSTGRP
jgi:hypothetical protein